MQRTWQLQEAKNKFSEVVERAIHEGPQAVSRRGKKAVVIVSAAEYERLKKGNDSLVDFFRKSPLRGLELERPRDFPRDVKL